MKRFLLFAIAITTICSVKAQDVIVMRDASEIQAKVTKVSPNEITYKRWGYLDGPSYTVSKSVVSCIKYPNGEKDIINTVQSYNQPNQHRSATTLDPKFQGFAYFGTTFSDWFAAPTFDISCGVKLYNHLYVGVQTGFHYIIPTRYHYFYDYDMYYIPIGLNVKGYLTKNRKVNPYINCSLGGYIRTTNYGGVRSGFFCQAGLGFDVKRFSFGIGYNCIVGLDSTSGYVQLGVRFGKN